VTAVKRASKWMILSKQDMVHPMVGQVGGTGCNRRPILTLRPDYVLKPLLQDHRGIREIAFYEAIRIIAQALPLHVQHTYVTFLTGREPLQKSNRNIVTTNIPDSTISYLLSTIASSITTAQTYLDTLAMAIAIFVQDPVVLQSENALRDAWRSIQREVDVIRRLQKFTAPYYGVLMMKHLHPKNKGGDMVDPSSSQWKDVDDAHLLLQDLTINYSKPCVMDLKMGVQTYVRCVIVMNFELISFSSPGVESLFLVSLISYRSLMLHRKSGLANMVNIPSKQSSDFVLLVCAFTTPSIRMPMRKAIAILRNLMVGL
jgi:hypothetical protein